MIYNRTAEERETIINYNQAEKEAQVYTWNKSLIKKLIKLLDERDDIILEQGNEECASFIVPKTWIKVSPPRTRNYTDEQRAAAAERMANARKNRTINGDS